MADMQEAIALLQRSHNLIRRLTYRPENSTLEERLAMLADLESFVADGCGHKVNHSLESPPTE